MSESGISKSRTSAVLLDKIVVCDSYPEHSIKENLHGKCWCDPEEIHIEDSTIFVHREEQ